MTILLNDDQYILNHCSRFLARKNEDPRHQFGQYSVGDARSEICEAWRFPIIDTYYDKNFKDNYSFNKVTFVFDGRSNFEFKKIEIFGDFSRLYEPILLKPVLFLGEPTGYYAVTLKISKGRVFRYKFKVDEDVMSDPINPQEAIDPNGEKWSRFFTHLCTKPITLEPWQYALVQQLVDHIAPFRTASAENFLTRYYNQLDAQDPANQFAFAYRLDQPIGIVNFIDKLLAREERHHLIDYQICLNLCLRALKNLDPEKAIEDIPLADFQTLYQQMASNSVPGWDKSQYADSSYFLTVLRRHAYTGAFSHPKYSGNVGALGWHWLAETFYEAPDRGDDKKRTLFDWARVTEKPLGRNSDYLG